MVEFLMNHFHSTYLIYNYRIHLLTFEGKRWPRPDDSHLEVVSHAPLIPRE